MKPKWFCCGECFYFKNNTIDSDDGLCYYDFPTEDVISIHFCSDWTCKRCWKQGLSEINHQVCKYISFDEDQLSK